MYKLLYPERVSVNRGNHENLEMNRRALDHGGGFYDEVHDKYDAQVCRLREGLCGAELSWRWFWDNARGVSSSCCVPARVRRRACPPSGFRVSSGVRALCSRSCCPVHLNAPRAGLHDVPAALRGPPARDRRVASSVFVVHGGLFRRDCRARAAPPLASTAAGSAPPQHGGDRGRAPLRLPVGRPAGTSTGVSRKPAHRGAELHPLRARRHAAASSATTRSRSASARTRCPPVAARLRGPARRAPHHGLHREQLLRADRATSARSSSSIPTCPTPLKSTWPRRSRSLVDEYTSGVADDKSEGSEQELTMNVDHMEKHAKMMQVVSLPSLLQVHLAVSCNGCQ